MVLQLLGSVLLTERGDLVEVQVEVRHVLVDVLAVLRLLVHACNPSKLLRVLGEVQAEDGILDEAAARAELLRAFAEDGQRLLNVLLESSTAHHLVFDPVQRRGSSDQTKEGQYNKRALHFRRAEPQTLACGASRFCTSKGL